MVHMYTDHSDVLPAEVDISSRFSRRISVKRPIATAAMDTVSEAAMAIAMAEAGGIASIHKNMTPEAQDKLVGKVKHRLHGLIKTPYTVFAGMTVAEHNANQARRRDEKKNLFDKFVVMETPESDKIAGVITDDDLDFCVDTKRSIQDFMSRNVTSAIPETTIEEAYVIMLEQRKKVLPLVRDGHLVGMYLFRDAKRICSGAHTTNNVDANGQLIVCAAVGVGDGAMRRMELLAPSGLNAAHIDTAHGDSKNVFDTIKRIKQAYPNVDVVAGNISRGESAKRLVDAGADSILVGQGPGAICTTRLVAGVGVPQVSAIYDCVSAIEDTDVPVIADGGIEYSGDLAVALALGASVAMVGRYVAGTDEAPGEITHWDGRLWKDYRGMGSIGAMRDSQSSQERCRHTGGALVPEGVEGLVDYQGPVSNVIDQLMGGLRKSMAYIGASTLDEFRQRAEVFLVPEGSESHPHGLKITKESPNYRGRG